MSNFSWATFDPQKAVDAMSGALPDGEYRVMIKKLRLVPTRSHTGTILYLTFEVIDGELAGRNCDLGFNIANDNPDAERIGQFQVGKIALAAGVKTISHDGHDLLYQKLFLFVKEDEYKGRKTNRFIDANPHATQGVADGQPDTVTVDSPPAAAPAPAPATKKLPWQ